MLNTHFLGSNSWAIENPENQLYHVVMCCANLYHLYNFKNLNNTNGGAPAY